MRNSNLDKRFDIDNEISEMLFDTEGYYRIINGQKVGQIEEKTQQDKDMNLIINRKRALKMSTTEYLKSDYNK